VRAGIVLLGLMVTALGISLIWSRLSRTPDASPTQTAHRAIRVQVLNGTGEGGVAGRLASYLRDGGFQVVEVRNADRPDYFATLVVARRGDLEPARAVARYLGGPPILRQTWDTDAAEVTVVLGSDRSRLRLE
jgi:hypothetical protein